MRCTAVLTSKIIIAPLEYSPLISRKKCKSVATGTIQLSLREILAASVGKFPFAPNSLVFMLFSVATSVCQCYMNVRNILQANVTTLMDNLIKLKQWLDKFKKKQWLKNKNKILCFWNKHSFPQLHCMIEGII